MGNFLHDFPKVGSDRRAHHSHSSKPFPSISVPDNRAQDFLAHKAC